MAFVNFCIKSIESDSFISVNLFKKGVQLQELLDKFLKSWLLSFYYVISFLHLVAETKALFDIRVECEKFIHVFLFEKLICTNPEKADEFGDSEMESNMATANVLTPPMVHSISANQAGTLLACGVENSGLLLFDIRTQFKFKTRALLMGHTAGVCQVVFPKFLPSVSGVEGQDLLISGGNDKKIISWRCYTDHLPEYRLVQIFYKNNQVVSNQTLLPTCSQMLLMEMQLENSIAQIKCKFGNLISLHEIH